MNKAKKILLWVLGGLVVVLAAVLGISYERKKIAALKRKASLAKAGTDIAVADARKEAAVKKEEDLAKEDEAHSEKVSAIEERIEKVKDETSGMDSSALADEFNSRYSPRR